MPSITCITTISLFIYLFAIGISGILIGFYSGRLLERRLIQKDLARLYELIADINKK